MTLFTHRGRASVAAYAFLAGTLFGMAGTGIGATVLGSAVFDDVPRHSYYDDAIGEMYNDGIIKGYDGTDDFGPDDYVTRGQVAVMLQRFKHEIGAASDDDSSSSRSRSSNSRSSSSSSSSNNPKGTVRFTTDTLSITENQNRITINVVRVGGNQGEVSVEYAVTGGSATAGSDFEAVSGTLTFENKETSQTFSITLMDDSSSEGDETVTLTLSSPSGGVSIGSPSTATLTIKDNESSNSSSSSSSSGNTSSTNSNGTLSFAADSYLINENSGNLTVTVIRTGGTNGTVGVSYATSNGTAQSGSDYTTTNGTLSFGPGETSKSFTVPIIDDTSLLGNKTFNLTLSSVTGGANLGLSPTATVSINDNENTSSTFGSGSIKLSKSTYLVTESEGSVKIVVQRVGGAQGTVSVDYATVNGSALSGSDYTSTSGTLTFQPGESSKIVAVPIIKDSNAENEDDFYFNLSNVSSTASLISPNSATISISN